MPCGVESAIEAVSSGRVHFVEMSARDGTQRARQLQPRPVPAPWRCQTHLATRRGQSAKQCRMSSSAVEHFFCQHATAEEGEPPAPPPTAASMASDQLCEASSSRQHARGALPPPVVRHAPNNVVCPPEGEAKRPMEYWEYDEALWHHSSFEGVQVRRGTTRRDSLTSDEPSEPLCALSSHATQDGSAIAAWSEYEQDYSARRGCLALSDRVLFSA